MYTHTHTYEHVFPTYTHKEKSKYKRTSEWSQVWRGRPREPEAHSLPCQLGLLLFPGLPTCLPVSNPSPPHSPTLSLCETRLERVALRMPQGARRDRSAHASGRPGHCGLGGVAQPGPSWPRLSCPGSDSRSRWHHLPVPAGRETAWLVTGVYLLSHLSLSTALT